MHPDRKDFEDSGNTLKTTAGVVKQVANRSSSQR